MGKLTGNCSGFSLIAICIVIMVIGLFSVAGLKLHSIYSEQKAIELTTKNMDLVKEAMKAYADINGHLPCPASLEANIDTQEFGKPVSPACPAGDIHGTNYDNTRGVRIGAVPVRALNLPDVAMLDGWKNRLVYAVTANFARTGADMTSPDGKITVNDIAGNSITALPGTAIYALISHGDDHRGAYNINGSKLSDCDLATVSGENCNGDGVFVSSMSKNYVDGAERFTSQITYLANYIGYQWEDAWGACNAPCEGTGTQNLEPVCKKISDDSIVADSFCASRGPKPTGTRPCNNTTQCPVACRCHCQTTGTYGEVIVCTSTCPPYLNCQPPEPPDGPCICTPTGPQGMYQICTQGGVPVPSCGGGGPGNDINGSNGGSGQGQGGGDGAGGGGG